MSIGAIPIPPAAAVPAAPAIDSVPPIAPGVPGTTLSPPEESAYQTWKSSLPERLRYEGDYDLRGFYQKNPNFKVDDPSQHMTDEFKLPNHPTFSNESKYYNDETAKFGGHWEGKVFVPNDDKFKKRVDESAGDEPKTPEDAAARNVSTSRVVGDEAVKNAEEKAASDVKTAEARKAFVDTHSQELQKILDTQEQHRQAAEQAITVARNKAETEPYHTLWETRSIGQKIAIAFGLLIGGVSWNENHVNRGAQMLEAATKQDFELQKQKHADLWRAVDEAEKGAKDLDTNQLRDLSAFNATQGAKWDRISSELGALIAANKGRSDVTTAKEAALKANETATTFWQNATSAAATARHQEATDKEHERHNREMEKAKAKKATGEGGGSSAVQAAAVKLREEIEAAQTSGKPLTGAQIDRRAFELKIPPVAKAGRVSVKTILDNIKEGGAINKLEISDKDANLIIYDPQTKEPVAKAGSVREKAALSKQDVQYGDAARRVSELAQDIRQNGATVTTPEAIQRRAARYANAIIGVAVTSPLGKTNESIHQEAASLGLSGTIDPDHLAGSIAKLLSGFTARVETVDHKEHEMKRLRQEFRNTVPITEEEKKKYSKRGGGGGESAADSGGKWIPIPSYLASNAKLKGKSEVQVNTAGDVIGAR